MATVQECTVRINPCSRSVCQTCPARPWSSCIVRSVWTSTRPNPQDTTTLTGRTSGLGFPTCCSWCTRNIGPNVPLTSSFRGCMDSKSIPWLIRFSSRRQPTSRLTRLNPDAVDGGQPKEQETYEQLTQLLRYFDAVTSLPSNSVKKK